MPRFGMGVRFEMGTSGSCGPFPWRIFRCYFLSGNYLNMFRCRWMVLSRDFPGNNGLKWGLSALKPLISLECILLTPVKCIVELSNSESFH